LSLYNKYRPHRWSEFLGQPEIIKQLQKMVEDETVPHSILFTGGTGQGKTSLARILSKELGTHKDDIKEYNIADSRGLDTIRTINESMSFFPMSGKVKVYLLDEVGELTSAAQKALLKSLEDTPNHCYFMLVTTNPEKLISTVKNRCSKFEMKPLSDDDMMSLLEAIQIKETSQVLSTDVLKAIIEHANGSAREALVTLEQVLYLDDVNSQLESISKISSVTKGNAFELVKMLLWSPKKWATVADLVKSLDPNEIEGIRKLLLKNAENELIKCGNSMRSAVLIIDSFKSDFFSSGMAGFVRSCFEVCYQNSQK
jgi:DNA polymerase III subunit gamma/tau